MSEENKALVQRMYAETDRAEGEIPEGVFAPNFTAHIAGSPPMDLGTFAGFIKVWYNNFSDWSHNVEQLVAEGDRVAIRAVAQATHTREFMGVPASGKRISVVNIGIARVAGGRIAEWWNSPDQLGLMQQLGLIPPPQSAK